MSFFDREREVAGEHEVVLALGPLEVAIGGLDGARAELLLRRYGAFARAGAPRHDALRVRVGLEDRDYFVEPAAEAEFTHVFLDYEDGRVRYLAYKVAGWFDVRAGAGVLLLARGTYEPDQRSFENYIRAAVAWQAAARGGALVHAASSVRRGRAYLFYGESGAGKSTLAAADRRGRVLSDDLSLVLPGAGGALEAVGSPFRGTYEGGEPVLGTFPLAAGFRLVKAPVAEVREVPRVRALAELVGNLTFVAEAFAQAPELFAQVERAWERVPLAHLHFRPDDSFWEAIDRAGL